MLTLSPSPGFHRWLEGEAQDEPEAVIQLKDELSELDWDVDSAEEKSELIAKVVFNYLMHAKRGKYGKPPH